MKDSFVISCILVLLSGLALGCSAPGVGLWITAWFCLAPLLFIVNLERSLFKTLIYGFLFGLAYNCVYGQWLLNLAPLDWLGFNGWQGQLMSCAALLILASQQALLVALFTLAYRLIFNSRLLNPSANYVWLTNWLHLIFVPLLWILIINKIGNAHSVIGLPWSMLEYSQYKNSYVIQIADTVGGVGISFVLVMINTLIERMAMRCFVERWKESTGGLRPPLHKKYLYSVGVDVIDRLKDPGGLMVSIVFSGNILIVILGYGQYILSKLELPPVNSVAVVQPNINIEMYKTERKYSLEELLSLETNLSKKCSPGLCVWTEGALPIRLAHNADILKQLQNTACQQKQSIIAGTIDQDNNGNFYNAAAAFSSDGKISGDYYHKRYLVPFGEYTPAFVDCLPYSQLIRTLTNTPAGTGYSAGNIATVLKVNDKLVAPLICFEVIAPELAAASVRAGGELLVNINDLSWFHKSIIGEQMIACAVMRAIENRRYFVFAANTGPSAIISPQGLIQSRMGQDLADVLKGKINFLSDLTFFTRHLWWM